MKLIKKIVVSLNLTRLPCVLFYFFRIFSIKNNRIVFVNFSGKGYGDNPKYIAEELKKGDYDLIWLVNNKKDKSFPKEVKKVKIFSIKACFYLTTAKVWINNTRFEHCVVKRKGQYYIQTWHGSFGVKKIEYNAIEKLSEYYKKVMKNDNKMIDLALSNCEFMTEKIFRESFKYKGEILKVGLPKDDIFSNYDESLIMKIKKYYNIPYDDRILLYAPTFRKSYSEINPYDIDFSSLKNTIEEATGDNYSILIRMHPRIASKAKELITNNSELIDVSYYEDVQELICACDILITDYSTTMTDAMIADKTVVLYANDINDYESERGYVFPYRELPFKITTSNEELINVLKNNSINELKKMPRLFVKNYLKIYETGKASKKVAERIKEVVNNSK